MRLRPQDVKRYSQFLALTSIEEINIDEDTLSSEFSLNFALNEKDEAEIGGSSGTASSTVQTDLSLVNIDDELATYLAKLNDGRPISPEFLCEHFTREFN
ncbi:hypothetical protein Q1695_011317 [Nippostrongylus brasiliensis]|nr:hypothetical protein Q1695_011317 [Nippostrongylus brasiliensis]